MAEFTVSEGQSVPFSLTWFPASEDPPRPVDAGFAIQDTDCLLYTSLQVRLVKELTGEGRPTGEKAPTHDEPGASVSGATACGAVEALHAVAKARRTIRPVAASLFRYEMCIRDRRSLTDGANKAAQP